MNIEISNQGIGSEKAVFSQVSKGDDKIFLTVYSACGERVGGVTMCADEFHAMAKAMEEMR